MAEFNINKLLVLLSKDIPIAAEKQTGFLDIVDQSNKETTICKVYKYFLDQDSSPAIAESLMYSLLSLIEAKYTEKEMLKELDFESYEVYLEVVTSKGRIDIVIKDTTEQSIIIIEVKVFHNIEGNDLQNYWEHYSKYKRENKVAIVLALDNVDLSGKNQQEDYIVITHNEWLSSVSVSIDKTTNSKNLIYFKDFITNMDFLTKAIDMNDQAKFYFEHAKKIDQVIETRQAAIDYSLNQLQIASNELGFEVYGRSSTYKCLKNSDSEEVYYTVFVEEILNPNFPVKIVLELFGHARTQSSRIKKSVLSSKYVKGLEMEDNSDSSFIHLFSRSRLLGPTEYDNLTDTLKELIEALEPVRKYIIKELNESN